MRYRHRLCIVVLVTAALALIAPGRQDPLAAGATIHVDAGATSGANNGTSWDDAYTDLQAALDAAEAGDQIWVAEGTYTPSAEHGGTGDRYRSFQLMNSVALYGGFDPSVGDTAFEDRDWEANPTVLSGDLNGDDGADFANNGENSYHVFYHPVGTDLDGTAILDGFTVSDGNANGDSPHNQGGGMYNASSSPALTNCVFESNSGDAYGGGMFNDLSSPALTNCTFSGNSAAHYGAGMYNTNSSSPALTGCNFEDNSADYGGGIFNHEGSAPALTNCSFSANLAGTFGGGMYNTGGSSPVLTGCAFSANSASGANGAGGGMYNDDSTPVLTNCTFSGNSASNYGGGMENITSSPVLTNCTFSGNSAGESGGAMDNYDNSSPTLTNCTFFGNWATYGGGISNLSDSSPVLTNCILWADTPEEILNGDSASTPLVTYSDIQGGCDADPRNVCGAGNIESDPLFVDPGNGDLHLGPDSPCIDAGDNDSPYLPDFDFEGDARVLDGDGDGTAIVDMGVDEAFWSRLYFPMVLRGY
jgi:hypothetical protein